MPATAAHPLTLDDLTQPWRLKRLRDFGRTEAVQVGEHELVVQDAAAYDRMWQTWRQLHRAEGAEGAESADGSSDPGFQPRRTRDVIGFDALLAQPEEHAQQLCDTGRAFTCHVGEHELIVQHAAAYDPFWEAWDRLDSVEKICEAMEQVKRGEWMTLEESKRRTFERLAQLEAERA